MNIRKYRFEVSTPARKVTSIIVASDSAENARADAYTALRNVFGPVARIKTAANDAKVMRRMPNNLEAVKGCYTTDADGTAIQWAWLVFAD